LLREEVVRIHEPGIVGDVDENDALADDSDYDAILRLGIANTRPIDHYKI
jgi:hypothetical protein